MLINLSNHPVALWSKPQREMAVARWGDVGDMTFPDINPSLSREELLPTVETYYAACRAKAEACGDKVAFHVMGESVFCFHLVGRLLQAGYTVVASTSTRNAVCNADGMKISQFEFVNFREY